MIYLCDSNLQTVASEVNYICINKARFDHSHMYVVCLSVHSLTEIK